MIRTLSLRFHPVKSALKAGKEALRRLVTVCQRQVQIQLLVTNREGLHGTVLHHQSHAVVCGYSIVSGREWYTVRVAAPPPVPVLPEPLAPPAALGVLVVIVISWFQADTLPA